MMTLRGSPPAAELATVIFAPSVPTNRCRYFLTMILPLSGESLNDRERGRLVEGVDYIFSTRRGRKRVCVPMIPRGCSAPSPVITYGDGLRVLQVDYVILATQPIPPEEAILNNGPIS